MPPPIQNNVREAVGLNNEINAFCNSNEESIYEEHIGRQGGGDWVSGSLTNTDSKYLNKAAGIINTNVMDNIITVEQGKEQLAGLKEKRTELETVNKNVGVTKVSYDGEDNSLEIPEDIDQKKTDIHAAIRAMVEVALPAVANQAKAEPVSTLKTSDSWLDAFQADDRAEKEERERRIAEADKNRYKGDKQDNTTIDSKAPTPSPLEEKKSKKKKEDEPKKAETDEEKEAKAKTADKNFEYMGHRSTDLREALGDSFSRMQATGSAIYNAPGAVAGAVMAAPAATSSTMTALSDTIKQPFTAVFAALEKVNTMLGGSKASAGKTSAATLEPEEVINISGPSTGPSS